MIETRVQRVSTAVAVVVTAGERVLFGQRRVAAGGVAWQLPGGWIQPGESPQQAAQREVSEETGLTLREMHFVGFTNNVFSEQQHSISLYFESECELATELLVREPDKCRGWEWKRWDEVNEPLYLPLKLLRQSGYRPFSPGQL